MRRFAHDLNILMLAGGVSLASFSIQAAFQITYTDLHYLPAVSSCAYATDGTQQFGSVNFEGHQETPHAVCWLGDPWTINFYKPWSGIWLPMSAIYATIDSQQAGWATVGVCQHALLWSDGGQLYVDLNPAGAGFSAALAMNGNSQVGWASFEPYVVRAALWSGSAESFVDLNPNGATESLVSAIAGQQQIGYAVIGATNHAALWTGTASSFVDLNPVLASASIGQGAWEMQQVGYAVIGGHSHAAMWFGSADSFVDLHPPGATESSVSATVGSFQAGYVTVAGSVHAALWSNSGRSFTDLHDVIGDGYTNSIAYGMWSDDKVVHVVGSADPVEAGSHAMLWKIQIVPPPLVLAGVQSSGGTNVMNLTWMNDGTACVLECSESLTDRWGVIPTAYSTNENWVSVTVSNTSPSQFYRLRIP